MEEPDYIFSEEEVKALSELGEILRSIRARLLREGKAKIVDGKIVFIEDEE